MSDHNASPNALRMNVLRSIDKRDRIGDLGVFELLTVGRADDSGAQTEGCGLSPLQACKLLIVLNLQNNPRQARRFAMLAILWSSPCDKAGNAWLRLREMARLNGLDIRHCLDQLADRETARGSDILSAACNLKEVDT
jgi:hypothetical protein